MKNKYLKSYLISVAGGCVGALITTMLVDDLGLSLLRLFFLILATATGVPLSVWLFEKKNNN